MYIFNSKNVFTGWVEEQAKGISPHFDLNKQFLKEMPAKKTKKDERNIDKKNNKNRFNDKKED